MAKNEITVHVKNDIPDVVLTKAVLLSLADIIDELREYDQTPPPKEAWMVLAGKAEGVRDGVLDIIDRMEQSRGVAAWLEDQNGRLCEAIRKKDAEIAILRKGDGE